MNIYSAFPSHYIKADLLKPNQELRLVVSEVKLEEVDDGVSKPVVYFAGKRAGLVLNRINSNTLADVWGAETDDWAGKEIILFRSMTEYQGRRVPCLRLRHPEPPQPEPPSLDPGDPQPGDEIPF